MLVGLNGSSGAGGCSPGVLRWLDDNCLFEAVEAERRGRNNAAVALLGSQLAADWPRWMADAVQAGACPVWAPLLRGASAALHWRTVASLRRSWGIEATVRPFNWSGNPLQPNYEPSVALPIHGGIANLTSVLSALGS